jgi:hypothetical protein
MTRNSRNAALLALALGAGLLAADSTARAEGELPATLEQCYLTLATTRSSPEGIALGRQLCDAAFGHSPRPLAFLDPRSKNCSEWWFDRHGRYEDADRYCSLEADGGGLWKLACQWKSDAKVTFVRLRESGNRLERVGELRGRDVGLAFRSLAGCVEHKLGASAP